MKISFSLERLATEVGGTFKGDGSLMLKGIAPLDSAEEGDLTFATNPRYLTAVGKTKASAVLSARELPGGPKNLLLAPNPYAAMAKIVGLFYPPNHPKAGVHPGSWVDATAVIHPEASVAAGVTVSAGARVGARTILYPGVYLGQKVSIGEDCLLYPNVTVREHCVLGDRVILQPGAVIGSDGFGFAKDGEAYRKIPQVGNVVLADDVEVGANTCVDRASLGTTRIGKGTKLDNLIQIGHNVVVGENTVMAALTGIAGSTKVGDRVVMAGQVGLVGHITVVDDVTLATRTAVLEDILKKGSYWGSPALEKGTEMRNVVVYHQLPEILKRLRVLEKALAESQDPLNKGK